MDSLLVRGEPMSRRPYSWSHCEECASGVMWLVTCGACACVYVEGSRVGCCCEVVRLVGVSKVGNMAQKTMMRTLSVEKNVIEPELAECGDLDVLSLSLSPSLSLSLSRLCNLERTKACSCRKYS